MLSRPSLGLAFTLAVAGVACTDPAPPDGPGVTSGVTRIEVPIAINSNVDLLFVIDNSPGAAPHRAKLLASYRRYMEVLESRPGGLTDVHIGVVTTDVGTRGGYDLGAAPAIGTGPGSCTSEGDGGELRRAASVDGNFISDLSRPDGTRERNYTGSLADAFVQLADAGSSGCTYARPLEATRRALANPANEGFFRRDAFLAVVLITPDDDCSFGSSTFPGGVLDRARCANTGGLVPIDTYVSLLKGSKDDPNKVVLIGAFLPPGEPACADTRAAPRLAAFFDGFPNRSGAASICEPDFTAPIELAGQLLKHVLGAPCISAPLLDVDPVADGLQPECVAWYSYLLDGERTEELVPACRADEPGPCYRIHDDPMSCIMGKGVELREPTRRFGAGSEALAILECVTRLELTP